jgi:hypothetical protein
LPRPGNLGMRTHKCYIFSPEQTLAAQVHWPVR